MEKFLLFLRRKISSFWSRCGYFFCLFLIPSILYADIQIIEIFPNTVDDKNLEYVEIRNTGCESVDIWGYMLEDALPKIYTVPSSTILRSYENYRFIRPVTKIELNNAGETVRLRNPWGIILSEYSYANSTKWVLISVPYTDTDCTPPEAPTPPPVSTETGATASENIVPPAEQNQWTSQEDNTPIESSTGSSPESIPSPRDESRSTDDSVVMSWWYIEPFWDTWSLDSVGGGDFMTWSDLIAGESSSWQVLTNTANDPLIVSTGSSIENSQPVFSGTLDPLMLLYDDADLDGYIDQLMVDYGRILTGSVDISVISIYSATGGLYRDRAILTETGHILSGFLSWTYLVLELREWDMIHTGSLKIDATTKSHLRLKNTLPPGFSTIFGQMPSDFFLTTSFNSYKNTARSTSYASSILSTLSQNTGSLMPSLTGVIFPQVFPTIQRYTSAVYESGSFICRVRDCRINLTFEPIFSSGFRMSDFNCRVTYASEVRDDCNPTQWDILNTGSIQILLTHKASWDTLFTQYPIVFDLISQPWVEQISYMLDTNPPVLIVEMDGKWKGYYQQIWDHELHCYAYTCSINLTADRSYDREGGKLRFIWLYDMQNYTDSKDPWVRTFSLGDHDIWVRAVDQAGNMSQIHYIVRVYPPVVEEKIIKPKKEKASKKEKVQKEVSEKSKKKSKKKLKMAFFEPPEVLIQNKVPQFLAENTIYCQTKTKYCSVNLKLENPVPGILYTWIYPDGSRIESSNPRSFRFDAGKGSIQLVASYKGSDMPIYTQSFRILVEKITKTRKKSNKKGVSSLSHSPDLKKDVSILKASPPWNAKASYSFILFLSFLTVLVWVFFTLQKYQKHRFSE